MSKVRDRLEPAVIWLVPLCIYGNTLFNIVFVLFGVDADSFLRKAIVYGSLVVITVLLYLCANYRLIICECLMLLVWVAICVCKIFVVYNRDFSSFVMAEYAGWMLGLLFWGGIFCCATRLQRMVIPAKFYSALVGLFAVIYIVYLCVGGSRATFFEWIDYLSMSSLFLHFLLILYFCIERRELGKIERVVSYASMFLIVGAVVCASCKRDVLSLILFLGVVVVRSIAGKNKRNLSIVIICVLSIFLFSWIGGNSDNRRKDLDEEMMSFERYLVDATEESVTPEFIYEEKSLRTLVDATEESVTPEFIYEEKSLRTIDSTIKWAQDVHKEVESVKLLHSEYEAMSYAEILADYVLYSEKLVQDFNNGVIDKQQYSDIIVNFRFMNNTSIGARMYLYGNCLYEFLQSPIMGNGVLHYYGKYNEYAHCVPLEVMSDFGVVGIVLMVLWLLICGKMFVQLLRGRVNNVWLDFLLFYVICTLPRDIFGEDLYSYMSVAKYILIPILCIKEMRKKDEYRDLMIQER